MFWLAILLGIYSYLIFTLGIAGVLHKSVIILLTLIIVSLYLYLHRKKFVFKFKIQKLRNKKFIILLLCLLGLQTFINLLGALGPELAFDALWYHLTLPKLYLQSNTIYHIPGGLLYYSDMPKLGEMLYVGALSFGNEIVAKILHFVFGILTSIAIYYFARRLFKPIYAILAVVIFYSNIVVAWESTTAYVDLIRTFYEILALWSFINWFETKKQKWFYLSAIMVGFAITTKLLAFSSLIIFSFMIGYIKLRQWKDLVIRLLAYWFIAILIPLPWFIFSLIHTGNPFFPFFSDVYPISAEPLSISGFIIDTWNIFVNASDPISPIYMIFLPLLFFIYPKMKNEIKLITLYSACAFVIWYFTPRTGGGRFLLPYLPAFSIVCAAVIDYFTRQKNSELLVRYLLGIVIFISIITVSYRAVAQQRYIPVVLGSQSKEDFLKDNLNFGFGDFYDINSYIKSHVNQSETVLLYGFHNLYYINFSFIDATWVKPGDNFSYIAVQNSKKPTRFKDWQLIYSNDKTMVKLYKPPIGECNKKCVY